MTVHKVKQWLLQNYIMTACMMGNSSKQDDELEHAHCCCDCSPLNNMFAIYEGKLETQHAKVGTCKADCYKLKTCHAKCLHCEFECLHDQA